MNVEIYWFNNIIFIIYIYYYYIFLLNSYSFKRSLAIRLQDKINQTLLFFFYVIKILFQH